MDVVTFNIPNDRIRVVFIHAGAFNSEVDRNRGSFNRFNIGVTSKWRPVWTFKRSSYGLVQIPLWPVVLAPLVVLAVRSISIRRKSLTDA